MNRQLILVTRPTSTIKMFSEHLDQNSDYDVINIDLDYTSIDISSSRFSESNCLLIDGSRYDLDDFISILNQARLLHSASRQIFCVLFNVSKKTEAQLLELYDGWYIFKGIFSAGCPEDMILKGLNEIFAGNYWLPRSFMKKNLEKNNPLLDKVPYTTDAIHDKLTPKEVDILDSICKGMSNTQMADTMYISENTVKVHVYNIFRKLNVKNRMQAANWYMEQTMQLQQLQQ